MAATSRGGSRRSTSGSPAGAVELPEVAGRVSRIVALAREPVGAGPVRARHARPRDPRDLVARARLEHGLPRLRLRQLALGRRRRSCSTCSPWSRARGPGTSRSARRCRRRARRSGRSSPRSASGCSGTPCCPARAGELARVAVLRRHLPHGKGTSATLFGTVFAHRLFDLFPIALLVAYVMATAKLPHWAVTGIVVVGLVGLALLTVAVLCRARERATASTSHGHAPRGGCWRWHGRASRCSGRPAPPPRRSSSRPSAGCSSSSPSGPSPRRSTGRAAPRGRARPRS